MPRSRSGQKIQAFIKYEIYGNYNLDDENQELLSTDRSSSLFKTKARIDDRQSLRPLRRLILLKKSGLAYIFIHRMLLEFFVEMTQQELRRCHFPQQMAFDFHGIWRIGKRLEHRNAAAYKRGRA